MIFSKPNDALAGPYEDIPVDKECTLMDYEVCSPQPNSALGF